MLIVVLVSNRQNATRTKYGDPGGSRTRDLLDENQMSWTTRRRDRIVANKPIHHTITGVECLVIEY